MVFKKRCFKKNINNPIINSCDFYYMFDICNTTFSNLIWTIFRVYNAIVFMLERGMNMKGKIKRGQTLRTLY